MAEGQPTTPEAEISVVIPYYAAENCVEELCARLSTTLSEITPDWQVVLVDDRSPDNGWRLIEEICASEPRIRGIRLSRNYGQHPAIAAGMQAASARWYVVMDCDLQDRPEDIAALYAKAQETGAEIVIAERESSGLGRRRSLSSYLFNRLLRWASGLDVSGNVGNFRIISHKVAEAYRSFPEQSPVFVIIMAQLGFEPTYLTLPRMERAHGSSSYTLWKLITLAASILAAYSNKPLRIMAFFGFAVTLAALVLGLVYFVLALFGYFGVQGFATIIILISAFGGLNVLMISLLGLYIGEILKETQRKPVFVVDRVIN